MSSSVRFTTRRWPSSENERKPHGAVSSIGSSSGARLPTRSLVLTRSAESLSTHRSAHSRTQVLAHHGDRLLGVTHVGTVAGCAKVAEGAQRQLTTEILADGARCNHVLGALHDERWHLDRREIAAIVREERRLGESFRDDGIGGTEARLELAGELGPIRVLHDRRRQKIRPAEVVLLHGFEQSLDVGSLESANVVGGVVDVA